eukprot:TRINITY_DN3211_c0_g1_i1.p1 TRINITY_DN3211_c0_g1~~TRINITY_DN3211_c0_g1_i1.p1  ORF type:complete len:985 (-),score=194.90 TRINITY_DN3211_c0_g1_i1:57-3011(-)
MSGLGGERAPRVPLDDEELSAILHDLKLPPPIAHLDSSGRSARVAPDSGMDFIKPVRKPTEREEKESRFLLKRYNQQLRAVSFTGLSYSHEVLYGNDTVPLAPLSALQPFLAVRESPLRAARRSKAGGSEASRLKMWVPHTIVYHRDRAPVWVWSDAHGQVCKSCEFSESRVLTTLGDARTGDTPVVVVKTPLTENPEGNELKLANSSEIASVMQGLGAGGVGCVQQLLRPKGLKACFTRCLWKESSAAQAWQITNRCFSEDSEEDDRNRLCVNTGLPDSCIIFPQKGVAVDEHAELCERLVRFLTRTLQPSVQFSSLAADFLRDNSNRVWLLQVKAFELRSSGVPRSPPSHSDTHSALSSSQRRPSYKKLTKCFSCLVPYRIEQLSSEMTAQMVLSAELHMRARGHSCSWFGRPGFQPAEEASSLYMAHRVCQKCFAVYRVDQELTELEVRFARSIGVPVQPGLTGSEMVHLESTDPSMPSPPSSLCSYRLFVWLSELRALPPLEELGLEPSATLFIEFSLFGSLTRVHLKPTGAIQKLRTFHFFLERCGELREFLVGTGEELKVHLCVLKPCYRVLATCSLPLHLLKPANEAPPGVLIESSVAEASTEVSTATETRVVHTEAPTEASTEVAHPPTEVSHTEAAHTDEAHEGVHTEATASDEAHEEVHTEATASGLLIEATPSRTPTEAAHTEAVTEAPIEALGEATEATPTEAPTEGETSTEATPADEAAPAEAPTIGAASTEAPTEGETSTEATPADEAAPAEAPTIGAASAEAAHTEAPAEATEVAAEAPTEAAPAEDSAVAPVVKLDVSQGFDQLLESSLRASLGCEYLGEFDSTLTKLRREQGAWQPVPDFFRSSPLPKEWVLYLERVNQFGVGADGPAVTVTTSMDRADKVGTEAEASERAAIDTEKVLSPPARHEPSTWALKVRVGRLSGCSSHQATKWWLQFDWFGHSFDSPYTCLLYTSPSPRDRTRSRMPSSA